MATYRYPYKCLKCGLHYNVYSWDGRWNKDHYAYCPECGVQDSLPLGREHMKGEIYQQVGAV